VIVEVEGGGGSGGGVGRGSVRDRGGGRVMAIGSGGEAR